MSWWCFSFFLFFTCPRYAREGVPVLPEASGAAAHDFTLADELGVEFRAIEGEEDVKVNACRRLSVSTLDAHKGSKSIRASHTVKGSLRCVHTLEIFLKILTREVGC